ILPPTRVSAPDFPGMNWVMESWGVQPVLNAGQGVKDHLRAAIQRLSRTPAQQTVYQRTGWGLFDGVPVYLHGGGAMGPIGTQKTIKVDLPDALGSMVLPAPPEGEELHTAVRASLSVLDVGPDHVTATVLGYRPGERLPGPPRERGLQRSHMRS